MKNLFIVIVLLIVLSSCEFNTDLEYVSKEVILNDTTKSSVFNVQFENQSNNIVIYTIINYIENVNVPEYKKTIIVTPNAKTKFICLDSAIKLVIKTEINGVIAEQTNNTNIFKAGNSYRITQLSGKRVIIDLLRPQAFKIEILNTLELQELTVLIKPLNIDNVLITSLDNIQSGETTITPWLLAGEYILTFKYNSISGVQKTMVKYFKEDEKNIYSFIVTADEIKEKPQI